MKKKTTIQVTFSITGVDLAARFTLANDSVLNSKAKRICDSLNEVSQLPAINWPEPFPYEENHASYEETLIDTYHIINGKVLEKIATVFEDPTLFPNQKNLQPVLESLLDEKENLALQSNPRKYEIACTSNNVCIPVSPTMHIVEGIVNTSMPPSGFTPWMWVPGSIGANASTQRAIHFNCHVEYVFTLEDA